MNTLSARAAPTQNTCIPASGWQLEARRAMSLRPLVPSRLHITQGRAWITLGQSHEGAGNVSGDLVLTAGESLVVAAGARLVMEPWQSSGGPVRFDWFAEPEAQTLAPVDRFGREVATPSRELAAALKQASVAFGRLMRGLFGYSEFLVAGRGRVLTPFESNPP
jgi:Protein of unknown function (DUF2917)